MNENKRGYWVYSVVAVIAGMGLIGYIVYLIYDLVIKLADKDFSNNTVMQALITLIITVFIGGYFSKWLENRNAKKLELYKIQTTISLNLIDLTSAHLHHPENEEISKLLTRESLKVKLYFPDQVLKILNEFIKSDNKVETYSNLMDELQKNIK